MYSEHLGRDLRRGEAQVNVSELVNCAIRTYSSPQILFIDKTIVIHCHCHHPFPLPQHHHCLHCLHHVHHEHWLDCEVRLHLIFILTLDQPTGPTAPFQTSPLQNQFLLFYSFSFFEILNCSKFLAKSWSRGRQFRIFAGLLQRRTIYY